MASIRTDEERRWRALQYRRELMMADGSTTVAALRLGVHRSHLFRVLREDNERIEAEHVRPRYPTRLELEAARLRVFKK